MRSIWLGHLFQHKLNPDNIGQEALQGCCSVNMRNSSRTLIALSLLSFPALAPAQNQKQSALSVKLLPAKSVYFDNQTGVPAVGKKAVVRLKKWGRFQLIQDRKKADLVFLLTADPYKGGYIITSGGQTGTIDKDGHIDEDRVPNYMPLAPIRDVYLSVIDPRTGESLWSDSHHWGGLLTGFNTAGERLIDKLRKQLNK
jgi:hypothetical protein